jgi:drug/metabolite transporter (DMT)-like permease
VRTTPDRPAGNTAAYVCLLGGGCGIAFAPIFVRLSDTGPVASAGWRVLLAAPVLWLWALRGGATAPALTPTTATLLAGVFFAADLGIWHWSIALTSVANATLLANLAPIFVTLGERVLFAQRVTRQFLAGMGIAIAGMFILVAPNIATSRVRLVGDALGALTAVFYGAPASPPSCCSRWRWSSHSVSFRRVRTAGSCWRRWLSSRRWWARG